MKRTIKVGKSIKYISYALLLLVLSVTIHSYYYYLKIPATIYDEVKNKQYDVIIVPGVPYDKGNWSLFLKWRIHWSIFLYKQGIAQNIIYSGSAVHTGYIEVDIMKKFGLKLGVPPSRIFTETKAEHSSENLYYSYLLAKELGFQKIALATDPFQSDMLDDFIEEHGMNIDLIPIVYSIADNIDMVEPEIDFDS
ncbi:MAG: YdcF family protein, partial [Flavobacteriales bacterium]|nr:YdcF family protein [Flavobacteriales bacterium]